MTTFYLIDANNQRKRFHAAALECVAQDDVVVLRAYAKRNAARPQHVLSVRDMTEEGLVDFLNSLGGCQAEYRKAYGEEHFAIRYHLADCKTRAIYLNHGKRGWETVQWPRRLSRLAL